MFESVGMCSQACQAYLKVNNVKAAVDSCVRLNQWDEGVRLAKQYNINQVDQLLAKQANNFLQQDKIFNAIELYRKARHYLDAAKLMMTVRFDGLTFNVLIPFNSYFRLLIKKLNKEIHHY
jgi:WD repeat-containing protein 35